MSHPAPHSTGEGPASARSHPGAVLVVDDNGVNRYILSQHVTQIGHRATAVDNGQGALNLLHEQPFDLVLLDVLMPGMDGHQVLESMKADAKLRDIPVIMVSGLDEIDSVVRCIQSGAEDYLPKPIDAVLLKARVNACLEKKYLRDEEIKRTEELQRALKELESAQTKLMTQEKLAFLGTMSAGIAHEIKNPLNFVTNFAQLMRELVRELRDEIDALKDAIEPDRYENLSDLLDHLDLNASKVNEHGQRADNIVKGMLLLSRGGTGKKQLSNINAILSQSVDLAFHGLRAHDTTFNVTIHKELDHALEPVFVTPGDLSRALLNIANNACFAAHEKKKSLDDRSYEPTLWSKTCKGADGKTLEIRIRDNGPGILKEHLDKIFNPFFTTKPAGVGTGLGLSIVHGIVEDHKGDIRVETEPGEYTEFIVSLPYLTKEPLLAQYASQTAS